MTVLARREAVAVFLAFAYAYFFSAVLRAITATLSPTLTQEFHLNARDLGLLAGGYFLGFALIQLPLGTWLDRHGPRKVILGFVTFAVLGCVFFGMAQNFYALLASRVLCGIGVSSCLMAPLTGFRRWFTPPVQLRTNSWMLMTGSMGMVASTLPVQWLLPLVGWRVLFWALAFLMLLSMLVIAWRVPDWTQGDSDGGGAQAGSYAAVWRHPYFRQMTPIGFFSYGGMIAIQALWAGPWLSRVAGYTPLQAAGGLFTLNVCMLVTFWSWGWANPWLQRNGFPTDRLIAWGLPVSLLVMAMIVTLGPAAGAWAITLFCVSSTFVSLAQPAVGMVFPATLAGRALSAYNLVIFLGTFVVQWSIGLLVDAFQAAGWSEVSSFRAAFAAYLATSVLSYAWFLWSRSHNRTKAP